MSIIIRTGRRLAGPVAQVYIHGQISSGIVNPRSCQMPEYITSLGSGEINDISPLALTLSTSQVKTVDGFWRWSSHWSIASASNWAARLGSPDRYIFMYRSIMLFLISFSLCSGVSADLIISMGCFFLLMFSSWSSSSSRSMRCRPAWWVWWVGQSIGLFAEWCCSPGSMLLRRVRGVGRCHVSRGSSLLR